ncbi:hypothetical protein [Photorhabdus luminescens]|uniref:hypothetical protein n=1 Tax=Photorhabdus luminescens TaxID=29488 RepID=UPI002240A1BA|nr:hypothetical protein [Photorhabdus luminescens]MCW7760355.1 hypothetical protein [Photorhabdus luminescens subsp. venezuelensis]
MLIRQVNILNFISCPKCYIGHNITPVLKDEFSRVTCVLETALAETTVADIVNRVEDCAGFPFTPHELGS